VFYIGTNYYGFQRQKDLRTIEGCLLDAFNETGIIDDGLKRLRYGAAGRTDKGVHALGQVIALSTSRQVILPAINAFLPKDIRCWAITCVSENFNPRFALSKHYKYFLPFEETMNIEEMKKAADHLIGIHNFKNLSKTNQHANPVREITQLKLKRINNILEFDIIGKSFLWEMVRKIVFVLTLVGKQLINLNEFKKLLDPNVTPKRGIPPAPAWGLLLYDIHYAPINFEKDYKIINEMFPYLKDEISRVSCLQKVFEEICMGID
jgi:tRNA pseudouridine38-40 synthase